MNARSCAAQVLAATAFEGEVAGNGHFLYNGQRHSDLIGARVGCLGGQLFEMEVLCRHVTETKLVSGAYGSRK